MYTNVKLFNGPMHKFANIYA